MRLSKIKKSVMLSAALLSSFSVQAAQQFVHFHQGDILLNPGNRVEIYMDANDCKGVSYAVQALIKDFRQVSGCQAILTSQSGSTHGKNSQPGILVGTLGHSAAIDQLVRQKRIDARQLQGKREKFIITVVDGQLVIAGSDR